MHQRSASEIREATPGDADGIDLLLKQLHRGETAMFSPGRIRQGGQSFVAVVEKEVVGFALATFVDYGLSAYGMVEELVVEPANRGKGLGGELLDACRTWLAGQKVQVIFVSALDADAAAFYVGRGFLRCTGPWLYRPA